MSHRSTLLSVAPEARNFPLGEKASEWIGPWKMRVVTVVRCTCCGLDLAELLGRDAPHPYCGVSEAPRDQAGVVCEAARHGIDLALAAGHAIEDVDVEVLLYDVPDLVVLALLQMPLQQLVGVSGDPQDELAGAEVQQRLVASHVLPLGQAGQNAQVVFIFQIHVHEQRVEDLGQLRSVTVQNRFDELLQAAVVNLVQGGVSLLAVGRQHHIDVRLILPSSWGEQGRVRCAT
ncbi:hypothetical protein F7725_016043 [Dissostichus mawsoni]|uniref:Uncharacterized protein n=1 Tax=Dissostichus mawsoni TaxID=36200 RepID=A0A7J5Y3I5_DISMA|nr:hypothetical protein F7725_016043 [Dissostichus mawsoni]